jgi:hypothetical protein
VLAAVLPRSLLPDVIWERGPLGLLDRLRLEPLWLTAPRPLEDLSLEGASALAAGLCCWWAWCLALLPRSWYARHGWRRALQLCCARIARHRASYWILAMGVVGSLAAAAVWGRGGIGWGGLLTALVGMAAGGGLIWAVRLIGAAALKREAMGFGDVTLMAMIGAFLGWQACLLVFVLAPMAGLVYGVLRLWIARDHEIPYAPFLCLAAAWVVTAPAGSS